MTLTKDEAELFRGALDVAAGLLQSDSVQHQNLGDIIKGLLAMIAKRVLAENEAIDG